MKGLLMANKNQSHRLTRQHKRTKGVVGIFGNEAKTHDAEVSKVAIKVLEILKRDFPLLEFRHRKSINTNLCKNKFVKREDSCLMLQAASIYTQGNGRRWMESDMSDVMLAIAKTSLQMLGRDLFRQLAGAEKRGATE
jgi:hypothetical protein